MSSLYPTSTSTLLGCSLLMHVIISLYFEYLMCVTSACPCVGQCHVRRVFFANICNKIKVWIKLMVYGHISCVIIALLPYWGGGSGRVFINPVFKPVPWQWTNLIKTDDKHLAVTRGYCKSISFLSIYVQMASKVLKQWPLTENEIITSYEGWKKLVKCTVIRCHLDALPHRWCHLG